MARERGGPQGRSLCNPPWRIVSLSRSRQRVRDRIRIRYRIRIRIYSVCFVLLRHVLRLLGFASRLLGTFFSLLPFA